MSRQKSEDRSGMTVDVGHRGADVHQRHDPPLLDRVVGLVGVLHGERVDIDELGILAGLS
jgi:hypothetical protein